MGIDLEISCAMKARNNTIEECAKIALSHRCSFGSMAEEIWATATAEAIAKDIRALVGEARTPQVESAEPPNPSTKSAIPKSVS